MSNPVSDGIKQIRAAHNLTQTELADMAGIPRATLANMEKDTSNPSITVVVKVARALGVQVEDLVTKQHSLKVTKINRKDMPITRQDDGNYISTRVSPLNASDVQINEVSMMPGCTTRGKPHPVGSHEFFLCLEGTASLEIVDVKFEVEAGDTIYFPGNLPHNYGNSGLKPVHAVSVVRINKGKNQ